MLYLFGRLALSDSFYFNQDFQQDEYQEDTAHAEHLEEPGAGAASHAVATAPPNPAALRQVASTKSPAPYPGR